MRLIELLARARVGTTWFWQIGRGGGRLHGFAVLQNTSSHLEVVYFVHVSTIKNLAGKTLANSTLIRQIRQSFPLYGMLKAGYNIVSPASQTTFPSK